MKIAIRNRCSDFNSYRAARVKSMFNVETGCNFERDFDLPVEGEPWRIGLVVGPSGSGKTSVGKALGKGITDIRAGWPDNRPIIDAIASGCEFNAVTRALASVGLGDVPAWLRPFRVLSNGEQFRAGLARLIAEAPPFAVIDEFSSVVDRQIAKVASRSFAKSWRRTTGQCVLLSCHYDIVEWLQPDWLFDTATGTFQRRRLRRPPKITLKIHRVNGAFWPLFETHHYLKLPHNIAARYYVGFIGETPVCHVATTPRLDIGAMRACRLVVMPEWQGIGLGTRFLSEVCRLTMAGDSGHGSRVWRGVYFNTSHPGLIASLRKAPGWRQVSAALCGVNKARSAAQINATRRNTTASTGYGGHFRATVGFLYSPHQGKGTK